MLQNKKKTSKKPSVLKMRKERNEEKKIFKKNWKLLIIVIDYRIIKKKNIKIKYQNIHKYNRSYSVMYYYKCLEK